MHFTGKQLDSETNNTYFGARYYATSANLARFMTPDWSADASPVPYAKLDNPQTLNLYAYLRNNPLNTVDPDGHGQTGTPTSNCGTSATAGGTSCPQQGGAANSGPTANPGTVTLTLNANSDNAIKVTVKTADQSNGGGYGMTIVATPRDANSKWLQTVNSTDDTPHAHTDYTQQAGSPTDPKPILGNTSGQGQQVLYDSPQFGSPNGGTKTFVSTVGQTDPNGTFKPNGSITWGFTVKDGQTTVMKPREATAAEQAGSFHLIRQENPTFKMGN
jgi:RHS repeat-associated protein